MRTIYRIEDEEFVLEGYRKFKGTLDHVSNLVIYVPSEDSYDLWETEIKGSYNEVVQDLLNFYADTDLIISGPPIIFSRLS